ncbi:F-gH [Chelonid alphaherpesvirus 5]|uniref:F-gH n=4 Tax=Chelonid alphaherpesvirus 5 TaxID=702736 RepID=V5NWR2_9ALPH|nr:F-gH [Chelonid alphaherpesvirus 5]AHA93347.1 F-gH [Chelonid alphaherpesvirus 5]
MPCPCRCGRAWRCLSLLLSWFLVPLCSGTAALQITITLPSVSNGRFHGGSPEVSRYNISTDDFAPPGHENAVRYTPLGSRQLADFNEFLKFALVDRYDGSAVDPSPFAPQNATPFPPTHIVEFGSDTFAKHEPNVVLVRTESLVKPANTASLLTSDLFYPVQFEGWGSIVQTGNIGSTGAVLGRDFLEIRYSDSLANAVVFCYRQRKHPLVLRYLRDYIPWYQSYSGHGDLSSLMLCTQNEKDADGAALIEQIKSLSRSFHTSLDWGEFIIRAELALLRYLASHSCSAVNRKLFLEVTFNLVFAAQRFTEKALERNYVSGKELLKFYVNSRLVDDLATRCADAATGVRKRTVSSFFGYYGAFAKLALAYYNATFAGAKNPLGHTQERKSSLLQFLQLLTLESLYADPDVLRPWLPTGLALNKMIKTIYKKALKSGKIEGEDRKMLFFTVHLKNGLSVSEMRDALLRITCLCSTGERDKEAIETQLKDGGGLLSLISPCSYAARRDTLQDSLRVRLLTGYSHASPDRLFSHRSPLFGLGQNAGHLTNHLLALNGLNLSRVFPELAGCIDTFDKTGLIALYPLNPHRTYIISSKIMVRNTVYRVGDTVIGMPLFVSYVSGTCVAATEVPGEDIREKFEVDGTSFSCAICGGLVVKYSELAGFLDAVYVDDIHTQRDIFGVDRKIPFLGDSALSQVRYLLLMPNGTVFRLGGVFAGEHEPPVRDIMIVVLSLLGTVGFIAFVIWLCVR